MFKINRFPIKKWVFLWIGLFAFIQIFPVRAVAAEYWPEGPEVESPAYILMEESTGTILYEKDSLQKNYPASITKIMTTLLALENCDLNEIVTFSEDAIDNTEGSGISRDYGEQMTMEQCLYAVMLNSANECAYAVAEHVGGDVGTFVGMMNARAEELGCQNTHFSNPHGLFEEDHYTCCYDMALIAREAYRNETFRIITGTARYTIPPTNKHAEQTDLQNHNEMLYPWQTYGQYKYDYCTGGKTGYTELARTTLVTYAEKDGMTLVCVIMHTESPSQWTDSRNLFDFGFDNFQIINIADNEAGYAPETVETGSLNGHQAFVGIDAESGIVLPKTAEFADVSSEITYDKISADTVGTITYTYAGHQVGSADIEKTGVEVERFHFGNEEDAGLEGTQGTGSAAGIDPEGDAEGDPEGLADKIQVNLYYILFGVLGAALLAALAFLALKLTGGIYAIRAGIEARRERNTHYQEITKKRSRWKRHR